MLHFLGHIFNIIYHIWLAKHKLPFFFKKPITTSYQETKLVNIVLIEVYFWRLDKYTCIN